MAEQTRALVVIDLQNDFMSPIGNFPVPDVCKQSLLENLTALVPRFRKAGGHIVWVQAIYENRSEEPAGMQGREKGTDEWLTAATHVYHIPCCEAGSFGAEIDPEVFPLIDPKDPLVTKGWYSSFNGSTALTDVLRARGVTDVYFCGLASGTCVLATVLDAIKIGEWQVHVVPDCCGWRRYNSHEEAMERMKKLPVTLTDSKQI